MKKFYKFHNLMLSKGQVRVFKSAIDLLKSEFPENELQISLPFEPRPWTNADEDGCVSIQRYVLRDNRFVRVYETTDTFEQMSIETVQFGHERGRDAFGPIVDWETLVMVRISRKGFYFEDDQEQQRKKDRGSR